MEDIKVIYEDKNFLAVDKPAGLLVHHVKPGVRSEKKEELTLTDWLIQNYPEVRNVGDDPVWRPGIVHRLDKETSGVIIVPKTQKYFEYLKSLFQESKIKKTYLAVVLGKVKPEHGIIDKPIGIKDGSVKRSTHSEKFSKTAITEYKTIKYFEDKNLSLLEVAPKTGRTHQIRVHLASIGHPIAGDKLYGSKNKNLGFGRLMLHALSLEFVLDDGKRIKIEAAEPSDFSLALLD